MPGVHVRTFSQFDWLDQEKESILTIPGSYWLCHKKNIYKFIFRYHRTVKSTIQFSYGRELLKIIRRIIKSHPSQGQQFGTQHLLVTYNCTSWTRQDKMFAILKFQQRTNDAAFSHAFVLTIRICPSSEESLFNMRYPIVKEADAGATFQDLNISLDAEEKLTKSMTCITNKVSSRKTAISQTKTKLDEISNCNIIDDTSNERSETTVNSNSRDSITNSINFHESLDEIYETKSVNSNIERNAKHHSINSMQQESLGACNKINEIEMKDAEDIDNEIKSTVVKEQDQKILKYNAFFSTESPLTGIIKHNVKKWSLSDNFSFMKEGNACTSNNKDNNTRSHNKKMSNESIVGPNDVPYQYFIEKEIENTKHDILSIDQPVQTNSQATVKNENEDIIPGIINDTAVNDTFVQKGHCSETLDLKSKENDEQHSNIQTLLNDNNQSQNNTCNKSYKIRKQKNKEAEKKTIPEDKILRSSNITDLVMEGLMFTIRQDKDSVAVIEQKTKLEVDEVLENSEKVETKAGEKCLLNSSLLRLENLVTMIDSSSRQKQNKTGHESGAHLLPLRIFPSCAVHNLNDANYADRLDKPNVFSYNRYDGMNDLMSPVPYRPQSRHQRVYSDINDNANLSANGDLMKKTKQLMEWQNIDSEQDKKDEMKVKEKEYEEEEEDIMPESLPPIIFSDKANIGLQNTDLLMDGMEDVKQTDKYESPVERCSDPIAMRAAGILAVPNKRKLQNASTKRKLNIPRVISDKLVTVEQIPPALQKVLQHKYRTRRFFPATVSSETLQYENIQHSTRNVIPETSSSLEDERMDCDIADKFIEVAVDSENIKRDKDKSSAMIGDSDLKINKDILEANDRHTHARNAKGSSSLETYRSSRRNSTLKHGSPRKLQDITEDFYYDLMQHTHNKDDTIRQRCLRQRRRSLDNPDDMKNGKVRIEMLKFIQDITEGVRVVVKRLDMNKSNLLKKNSALATCTHM